MDEHTSHEQAYKNGYEQGEWQMFWNITSAYFGKEYYFLDKKTGTVYSRLSHEELPSKDAAYNEFLNHATSY